MKRQLPPLNALKAFESAARNSSFSAAADELAVTRSAVSHQIKALEDYLGVELFVRRNRAIDLSTEGKEYYPVLRDAFDRIASGTIRLKESSSHKILTLQLYSTFAVRWLIPRLRQFRLLYPDIQIHMQTSHSDVDFRHDLVDLGLSKGRVDDVNIHYEYMFTPEIMPICSPQLLEQPNALRCPEDLSQQTILQVASSARDWHDWLDRFKLHDIVPESGIVVDSYEHAINMAIKGMGVAIGFPHYVAQDLELGVLVEPFPEMRIQSPVSWYLACPKGKEDNPPVKAFRTWLQSQVRGDSVIKPAT